MKHIMYIPLDERPCNYLYPQYICESKKDLTIISPDISVLGRKKKSADIERLWDFIFENVFKVEAIIISVEMLCYGGLLPSRLHYFDNFHAEKMIKMIKKIKEINKEIKVYASNLIMRTPKYSSSDEEPDYYENFGEQIFKRAYLLDKKKRVFLNNKEQEELISLQQNIPIQFVNDYEKRRKYNIDFNLKILNLVVEGDIDFLSIPQDDSAEFGYTAIDQKIISKVIYEKRLQKKVHMYPGADEVGCSLLARVLNDMENKKTKIYPFYASSFGPQIIPLYEDRPMQESLKSHIMVTNSVIVSNAEDADLILAINCPGKVMQEAFNQDDKDLTYTSFRNMLWFVEEIKKFIISGKKVAISDSAFSNGGELELIYLLDDYEILDKIISYKGWNTNCNTLGSTIAQGAIAVYGKVDYTIIKKNLIYHLLEDVFYQSIVRKFISENILPKIGLSYFSLGNQTSDITKIIEKEIINNYNMVIRNSFKDINIKTINVIAPWNRMFEVQIDLNIENINS